MRTVDTLTAPQLVAGITKLLADAKHREQPEMNFPVEMRYRELIFQLESFIENKPSVCTTDEKKT